LQHRKKNGEKMNPKAHWARDGEDLEFKISTLERRPVTAIPYSQWREKHPRVRGQGGPGWAHVENYAAPERDLREQKSLTRQNPKRKFKGPVSR